MDAQTPATALIYSTNIEKIITALAEADDGMLELSVEESRELFAHQRALVDSSYDYIEQLRADAVILQNKAKMFKEAAQTLENQANRLEKFFQYALVKNQQSEVFGFDMKASLRQRRVFKIIQPPTASHAVNFPKCVNAKIIWRTPEPTEDMVRLLQINDLDRHLLTNNYQWDVVEVKKLLEEKPASLLGHCEQVITQYVQFGANKHGGKAADKPSVKKHRNRSEPVSQTESADRSGTP